jgi:hypothetical protein
VKPLVRVLVVTDDWPGNTVNGGFLKWTEQAASAATGRNSREFHLGEFLSVLGNTAWVGFDTEITKAHRTPAGSTGTPAQIAADRGADVVNFRFGQAFTVNGQARQLADYDMVLLFAIEAGNPDPALAGEAEAIAQFMENGGGFFATGDHANLGAPLCGLIPRVRSMRRWWSGGGAGSGPEAPPPSGAMRHDTTQPGPDGITHFEDQSDEVAQPITPAWYAAGLTSKQGYVARKYLPHPLLCSPQGAVKFLPDHMHEGWCEVPTALDGTFTLGGQATREYPDYTPDNAPSGYVPRPLPPEVVATGHVKLNTTSPALDTAAHTGGTAATNDVTFGVIGAWDGHRVSKGRVVVDSTWHHFFDINLTGDRYLEDDALGAQHEQKLHGFYVPDGSGGRVACDEYKMIQWYFRNIVYWLIPAKRHASVWWNTLFEVIRRPRLLEELGTIKEANDLKSLKLEHVFYVAQLAQEYLSQARGACATYTIKVILYKPVIPWWEWIQEVVDVWDPVEKSLPKTRFKDLRRDMLSAAMGVGPQPELLGTMGLGAAVLAATLAQRTAGERGGADERMVSAERLLPDVSRHFATLLVAELNRGVAASKRLARVVEAASGRE